LLNQPVIPVAKTPRPNGFSILEIVFVCGLIGIISAIAVPMFGNLLADFRVSGDARSVSNAVAVAKMRAASDFSRVRLYVNLTSGGFHMETWNKTTAQWVSEGGETFLSPGVSFSFGATATSPPSTQGAIAQAPLCTDNASPPVAIANTACVMFNSRGVPIDSNFAPTNSDALYVTDGQAVFGMTIAATGMLRNWRTLTTTTAWIIK
jgi:Tfp pilus assembly protein FimT